jgi:hypothetical protein
MGRVSQAPVRSLTSRAPLTGCALPWESPVPPLRIGLRIIHHRLHAVGPRSAVGPPRESRCVTLRAKRWAARPPPPERESDPAWKQIHESPIRARARARTRVRAPPRVCLNAHQTGGSTVARATQQMVTPRPTGTGPDSAAAYVFENGIASRMPAIIADEVCRARACSRPCQLPRAAGRARRFLAGLCKRMRAAGVTAPCRARCNMLRNVATYLAANARAARPQPHFAELTRFMPKMAGLKATPDWQLYLGGAYACPGPQSPPALSPHGPAERRRSRAAPYSARAVRCGALCNARALQGRPAAFCRRVCAGRIGCAG